MDGEVFVPTAWLADHLHDSNIAVVDVRPPFFYAQDHIPGALNLPVFLFSDPSGPPPAAAFGDRLGQLGIRPEDHIVVYDDGASPMAARLFWVLGAIGHEHASLLDGGITLWLHEARPSETAPVKRERAEYVAKNLDSSVKIDIAGMRNLVETDGAVILDVRSPGEYLGHQATAQRNGHIPGALNVEWSNALDEEGGVARLHSVEKLRALYADAGISADRKVVVYCQSGSRSSHTFAVLKHLGYADVSNYSPGWQEWGNTPHVPVEE